MTGTVRPVKVGESIPYPSGSETVGVTAEPSCGASNGRWYCCTHTEGFANQFQKDSHIARGDHVLAWVCFEHGPEVP